MNNCKVCIGIGCVYCREEKECTGIIASLRNNVWFDRDRGSFNQDQRLRILKRKSCKCKSCQISLDQLMEDGKDLMDCTYYFTSENGKPLEEGEYELMFDWDHDYEGWGSGGIVDVKLRKV